MFFSRGKNKIKIDYVLADIYKEYKKEIEKGSIYDLSYIEFASICTSFNKKVIDFLFLKAGSVKSLSRLGTFQVLKRKQSLDKLSIDFKATNETGKTVYHLNDHSNGYRVQIKWFKQKAYLKFKSFYQFIPTRANKRRLAQLFKTGKYDYFTVG